MGIHQLASNIASKIHEHYPEGSSREVLKYGLIVMLNQCIVVSSVLLVGLMTERFLISLVIVSIFSLLRYVSGGLHFQSPMVCIVFSTFFLLASIYIPVEYWYNGLAFNLVALIILSITAPSGIKRSRIDKKYYPVLKLISICIVASNFLIQSPEIATAFFLQSLTTLRIFHQILRDKNW